MNSFSLNSCSVLNSCGSSRRGGERGVALVLTLIMLAVITVLTVIFLATARRNRSSTTVRIDQTTAEFAAETAYQHATGKIIERILNDRNLLSFDFFVSRPLAYGYATNNGVVRPADRDAIPVVLNNSNTVNTFLDLNRTRFFDDPGASNNRPFGDPIWLGILDRPWTNHLPNNRFVARIAYVVQPVGKSLDLNTIHHDTARPAFNPSFGFMRNQGFGPWELNFAAFLHELNPGYWDYSYANVGGKPNTSGQAFQDALSIVRYREGWPADALSVPVSQNFVSVYPDAIANNFPPTSIDVYSDGNQLGFPVGEDISQLDDDNRPAQKLTRWPGADTTNHFFHIQELFDRADPANDRSNKVTVGFHQGLTNTLANDGLAYYKLLAQLGTQTGSDFDDRINLNFADKHAKLPGQSYSATNFVPWDSTPQLRLAFFTNVAERIFLAQSNELNAATNFVVRSMLEIPVFPTNRYSTAIHRILQQAANILDATSSSNYPSVFRPLFGPGPVAGVNYIVGYTCDNRVSTLKTWLDANTNGIPLVVGAKKGFPNFNEFSIFSEFLTSRKLQVTRLTTNGVPNATNQMYLLGISNSLNVELWNSYSNPVPRAVDIVVSNYTTVSLTNNLGFLKQAVFSSLIPTTIVAQAWPGRDNRLSFQVVPLQTNQAFLTNSMYYFPPQNQFVPINTNTFDQTTGYPVPSWTMTLSNRMTCLMSEGGTIFDFVLLNDNFEVDLTKELLSSRNPYEPGAPPGLADLWNTNRPSPTSPTYGVLKQLEISVGGSVYNSLSANDWVAYGQARRPNDKDSAIINFREFVKFPQDPGVRAPANNSLAIQTGFNPAAKLVVQSTWQANDPLVHYHPEDLRFGPKTNAQYLKPTQASSNLPPATLGRFNTVYAPWGGNTNDRDWSINARSVLRTIKDAGVYSSDEWQFPSNKFANVGLLGRVHRGTPWQSIYFKPEIATLDEWSSQSVDLAAINNREVSRTHPTNDWLLADMFTVSLDERTSRGLVSMNQTNLETWSALFSGVLVLSNTHAAPDIGTIRTNQELFMEPAGGNLSGPFMQIWTNIHHYQVTNGRPVTTVGELIQKVPELTIHSPFLNLEADDDPQPYRRRFGIDDFAYEQIPQQILSLLRVGQSRFVIYAYGQALKPERINPGSGAVENYQVTAEFATRTVLRVEGDPRRRVRVVVESFNILPPD